MAEGPLECNALSLGPEIQEWLKVEQIDLTLYNFDEGIGNTTAFTMPSFSDQTASCGPAYITDLTQLAPLELGYAAGPMAQGPSWYRPIIYYRLIYYRLHSATSP